MFWLAVIIMLIPVVLVVLSFISGWGKPSPIDKFLKK